MPRTINDIIPPSRRRQMNEEAQVSDHTSFTPPATPPPSYTPPPTMPSPSSEPPRITIRTGRTFPYGTALIALVVIALCAGALYAFGDAKVTITPETADASNISGTFTATSGSGDLPYTVETVTKTASVAVPAESTLTANDSAQGTIVVSNTQSKSQTLINNTRFATPAGLIFHIHAPITIPAATASGPGTLSVTVYADQPGATYNVPPTTFTVPGLKGSAQYDEVTATSNTAMTGGFSGTRPAVSQGTDDTQHATLQASLATGLQAALTSRIPSGYVLVPGSSVTSYQALPDTASSTNVAITEQGTVTAVVFPADALAKALAYKVAGTYNGEPVTLTDVSKLQLTPAATSTDLTTAQTYSFNLSGSTTIIWKVDTSKIAGAVAGKTRDSAQQILSGFPEVSSAVLTLRPFWTSKFPLDPSHIKVTVTPPPSGS